MAYKNQALSSASQNVPYYNLVNSQFSQVIAQFEQKNPDQPVYVMGYGDTTRPLFPGVVEALSEAVTRLGQVDSYTGYENVAGLLPLREKLCTTYYQEQYGVTLDSSEIFITEGAHTVCGTIHEIFALDSQIAYQDPCYPVFFEANKIEGQNNAHFLPCLEANGFIPVLPSTKVDLIYLCSPNNPTGATLNYEQLQAFVQYARENNAVIVYDTVYNHFIRTVDLPPRTIYEIEGAKECAIEINSFSKVANFTGLRVGWCVVPHQLSVQNSSLGELNLMYRHRQSIKGWGTSNIAQYGALAVLSEPGQLACQQNCDYYLENAHILRSGFEKAGFTCYGGENIPFLWVRSVDDMKSWQFFKFLLHHTGLAGIPGSFFGTCGEGFLRFSTLGKRANIETAVYNGLSRL